PLADEILQPDPMEHLQHAPADIAEAILLIEEEEPIRRTLEHGPQLRRLTFRFLTRDLLPVALRGELAHQARIAYRERRAVGEGALPRIGVIRGDPSQDAVGIDERKGAPVAEPLDDAVNDAAKRLSLVASHVVEKRRRDLRQDAVAALRFAQAGALGFELDGVAHCVLLEHEACANLGPPTTTRVLTGSTLRTRRCADTRRLLHCASLMDPRITAEVVRQHGLTEEEYRRILGHLGREPNLVELGIFSAMWSEHCSYKSSRRFLKHLPTKGARVLQGPGENAGVVEVGGGLAVE